MFTDTNLYHCVLTPDPIAEGTNQHTVYHSISCSKMQLSELIKVFCISQSYFILRETICMLSVTLYDKNDSKKDQFEFRRSTAA